MKSILFVCLGNICRSPTAEAVFRGKANKLGLSLQFDSVGTSAYHQGEAPDPRSCDAAQQRGFDFSGIRSRQIASHDLARFDLILAADKENLAELQKLASPNQQHKLGLMLQWGDLPYSEVPDPYYGGANGFALVLDLIEESAHNLLSKIAAAKC
ncbi:low molecular weight phosphotyrosine protein phosphatase [Ferrimonas lipolytica]|uniref:protein-tyrosine-phosphatase n=1 Tax=Ferrimonas lipolytica TaxID=2724191 RepID=A0A6H1UKF8_9GAMM|nr:low molecular weight phosphotyrosine protein phosphatase [Ferrimonas lipolytica]